MPAGDASRKRRSQGDDNEDSWEAFHRRYAQLMPQPAIGVATAPAVAPATPPIGPARANPATPPAAPPPMASWVVVQPPNDKVTTTARTSFVRTATLTRDKRAAPAPGCDELGCRSRREGSKNIPPYRPQPKPTRLRVKFYSNLNEPGVTGGRGRRPDGGLVRRA